MIALHVNLPRPRGDRYKDVNFAKLVCNYISSIKGVRCENILPHDIGDIPSEYGCEASACKYILFRLKDIPFKRLERVAYVYPDKIICYLAHANQPPLLLESPTK